LQVVENKAGGSEEVKKLAKELVKKVVEVTALVNNAESKDIRAQSELKELALQNTEKMAQIKDEVRQIVNQGRETAIKLQANVERVSDLEARVSRLESQVTGKK